MKMTGFLLKIILGKNADPQDAVSRGRIGKLSGAVGLAANVLLFVLKLLAGLLAGSVSIMADALNNLSDATSSVVTLLGFKLAERPADADHPYGHARYEYLSGLAVATIVVLIGFELAKTAIKKIIHPLPVEFSLLTVMVLLSSIGIKLWLMRFNNKMGKLIDSKTLGAAAIDSRNDCLATGAVLAAGLLERVTTLQVDGIMGLAVAIFILYSGWLLVQETVSRLLGERADAALCQQIVDYIRSNPKVLGYHDLMVHDYGPGQCFASIHVEMDKNEDPLECHEIIDEMERQCQKQYGVHLVIHYDPVVTDDPELDRMRTLVLENLQTKDERLSIHDFRMTYGSDRTTLIFDVTLPAELQGQESTIQTAVEIALRDLTHKKYEALITFDPEN